VVERVDARAVRVRGGQTLRGCEIDVPGDPSAAAFWLVAGAIVPGSRLTIERVTVNPTRSGALEVLRAMGADLCETARDPMAGEPVADLEVVYAPLRATVVAGDLMVRSIDEFPILAVAAATAQGETRFADGAELRVKESDRIAAMAAGLERLGVGVEVEDDGMRVRGGGPIRGGEVESLGDHRIAMAFAILALVAESPVTIRGADAIGVSDPGFLRTLHALGGVGT
jgi:3-phosphoshikimate 1-carboxyvinyltransferase